MINFLKYRFACLLFAAALLATAIAAYFVNGFRYSVDFTGGTQVLFKFSQDVASDKVREALKSGGYDSFELREFSQREYLVRIQKFESDAKGTAERVQSALEKANLADRAEILQTDSVGPNIGESLKVNSIKAVLIAIICMLLYIGLRFQFAFSVGAVVALIHDTLVILTFFLLFKVEINPDVIAAILLILGYSVNDTIVIFARIRENLVLLRGESISNIVNISINETLRRTILTSFATLLVVLSMVILGGEALRNLSLALVIGIIFGTYSSIFIASPVMLLLYKTKK